MKIVICEDEQFQRDLIKETLSIWCGDNKIPCQIIEYENSEELLFRKEEHWDADLYILDIEMPGMNGMELARKIRVKDREVGILFVTGYENYVFEGYEVNAIAYLLKPYQQDRFFSCMNDMQERLANQRKFLMMGSNENQQKIYIEDILYLESDDHKVRVITKNGEIIHRESLEKLKNQLPQDEFCQCHRSYLVHLTLMKRIRKNEVELVDETKVPIARGKWQVLNEAYLNYYRGKQLWK